MKWIIGVQNAEEPPKENVVKTIIVNYLAHYVVVVATNVRICVPKIAKRVPVKFVKK